MTVVLTPPQAEVQAGERVRFEATLFDAAGNAIVEAPKNALEWEVGTGLKIKEQKGTKIDVEADVPAQASATAAAATPAAATGIEVIVKLYGSIEVEADTSYVTVQMVPILPALDQVEREAGAVGSVLLVDGWSGDSTTPCTTMSCAILAGCLNDKEVQFDEVGVFDNVKGACPVEGRGEVALFSKDKMLVFHEFPWTGGADLVDKKAIPGRLALPVNVAVAVTGPDASAAMTQADDDMMLADLRFEENRTGVTLSIVNGINEVDVAEIGNVHTNCEKWQSEVQSADPATHPAEYVTGVVNVYYVDSIDDGNDPRAVACHRTATLLEPVILVSWGNHATSSLAHEFGHTLGLTQRAYPFSGHVTSSMPGFNNKNLMWKTTQDDDPQDRIEFTLGQAFRMSVDPLSWLNQGAQYPITGSPQPLRVGDSRFCQCDPHRGGREVGWPAWEDPDLEQACPPLILTVGSGPWTGDAMLPHHCADVVVLTKTEEDDAARIIANGAVGRQGRCLSRLGEPYTLPNTKYQMALFPNLLAPDVTCPSWIAAFFPDAAMIYEDVPIGAEPPRATLGDVLSIDQILKPRIPVKLVFRMLGGGDANLEAQAVSDYQAAVAILEDEHPTGLDLEASFDWGVTTTGTSLSSLGPVDVDVINVFYLPAVAPGDPLEPLQSQLASDFGASNLTAGGLARIVIPGDPALRSPTSLAHHLGHVLGLVDVTATKSNVMWSDASDTGATRSGVTLGQIFRFHMRATSWLRINALYALDAALGPAKTCATVGECPPLSLGGSE